MPRDGTKTKFPSAGGGAWSTKGWFIPWRRLMYIRMYRRNLYTIPPLGRTLCTNRRGWMRYNWWLCRRMNNPMMGTSCLRWSYVPRQQQHNQMGMTWTVRRQLRRCAQLPGLIQLFFSSSPPLVRQRTKQRRPKGRKVPDADRTVERAKPGAKTGRREREAEHPARHGGTCHFAPAIFIIVTC